MHINTYLSIQDIDGALLRHGAISSAGFRLPNKCFRCTGRRETPQSHVAPSAMPFRAGALAIIAENELGMPLIYDSYLLVYI